MKSILMSCIILFTMIFLSACNNSVTENAEQKETQYSEEPKWTDSPQQSESYEESEIVVNETLDWSEITENGVDEEMFVRNLDTDVLETVAAELQALVEKEMEEERANPEIIFTEGFIRVFRSTQYNNVLEMGDCAMKPLYWIIYKSPNAGLYEYICAVALAELSGYDFKNENGYNSWSNSKEFVERFNEKILSERK